jgi:hypothetical protein
MLFSIENARQSLPRFWLTLAFGSMLMATLFLFPLFGVDFGGNLPTPIILVSVVITGSVGLVVGIYITFRSDLGTDFAFFRAVFLFFLMEIAAAGGCAALAIKIAGRPDLIWHAFSTNGLIIIASMLVSMYHEAKAMQWWGSENQDHWKSILEKYIDSVKNQVSPLLTASLLSAESQDKNKRYSIWIAISGAVNIPLLFEIFGGGRNEAMLIAAPIFTGVFVYVNFKHCGASLVRLLLLRKLEKENGRKFINADFEKIQELRRSFFLSRWLMKDYASPPSEASAISLPSQMHKPRKKKC